MEYFKQFLCEDNGHFSSQRLIYVVANICVWSVWTYSSIHLGQPAPISVEMLMGLGIAQAGKVGQKIFEDKSK